MVLPSRIRCRPTAAARRLGQALRSAQTRLESTQPDPDGAAPVDNSNVVVFSGIQPTGVPHLGNYLGAMRQWKQLQDHIPPGGKALYSIVDLHAITMPQDAPILRHRSKEMFAALLAVGLDPEKSTIFYQSSVPAHAELMWILSCTASMGYLGRMTQWKSKITGGHEAVDVNSNEVAGRLKLGLYSYPVLQAADILVHRATHVPVGDDQRQHIEFARECVTNFNHAYPGGDFVAPETITAPSPRIMSLQNPWNKMSKSAPNHRSRILITAEPDEIRSRIKNAVTDSLGKVTYDPERRPGVSNLLEIFAQCDHERSAEQIAHDLQNAGLGELKEKTADAVVQELAGIRERYNDFLSRKGGVWIAELAAEGAAKAQAGAAETMRMVRDVVGLAPL